MTLAVGCQPNVAIAIATTPTSTAGTKESTAWNADMAKAFRR
jgi:hypothetical protein